MNLTQLIDQAIKKGFKEAVFADIDRKHTINPGAIVFGTLCYNGAGASKLPVHYIQFNRLNNKAAFVKLSKTPGGVIVGKPAYMSFNMKDVDNLDTILEEMMGSYGEAQA